MVEVGGQSGQFIAGGRSLIGASRRLNGEVPYGHQAAVHFPSDLCLLFGGCRDHDGALVNDRYRGGNVIQHGPCLTSHTQGSASLFRAQGSSLDHAIGTGLDRRNHQFDFLSRLPRTVSERPNLIGDHGKATPLVSGTCCFDSGIQGKQVGLLGDVAYHIEHLADIPCLSSKALDMPAGVTDARR